MYICLLFNKYTLVFFHAMLDPRILLHPHTTTVTPLYVALVPLSTQCLFLGGGMFV